MILFPRIWNVLSLEKEITQFIYDEKISKDDYDEFVNDTNEHINNTLSKIENLKSALLELKTTA
ncbi:hypothetical protein C6W24_17235 [Bacillus atrophaeus]|nr:hypothetical protein C6W24_17235 [Bacillus atrophaeus]